MSTLTITLPEGYEEPFAVVVLAGPVGDSDDYSTYATVLYVERGEVVAEEEIGGGTEIQILGHTARAIRRRRADPP